MKVLFIVRSTLFTVRGGDTTQVVETARHLQLLGTEVHICKASETIDYRPYDLLHFFNIIRPADMLVHIRRSGKPFVVSTILVDYSVYDKFHRSGLAGRLFRLMPAHRIEYAKTLYRATRRQEGVASAEYLWKGHHKSIQSILRKASMVLVNTEEEYRRLVTQYQETPPFSIVTNGINKELFSAHPEVPREKDLVLCAARIEGIKNQLQLIHALNKSRFRLLLVGNPAPNQQSYYQRCRSAAGANIHFIQQLSQEELLLYYARARVHVLPSWFEVCGLSSLEAAAMGCNVVITKNGYAESYFNNEAFYCDPASPDSIRAAVEAAAVSPLSNSLQERIRREYTWEETAGKTQFIYRKICGL
ncbi:MAG: glycosyltransferase family 4 protein [Ferruginibacter sp.]